MPLLLYIIAGLAPSIVWLAFYLRKDSHPESNPMIAKVFLWGMIAPLPVALIEVGFNDIVESLPLPQILIIGLNSFIGIAFAEELLKYLVVRSKVIRSSHIDEPIDLMLYMIIAGLGFAATENLLMIFRSDTTLTYAGIASIVFIRLFGATLLHALCSGTVGFFLALAYRETENRTMLTILGLTTAIALHGLYNFSIMGLTTELRLIIPITIVFTLALSVSLEFKKIKKFTGVCRVITKKA
ncbi:MAG: PrsW family glutamic-type intramembrane protease [bacterium]